MNLHEGQQYERIHDAWRSVRMFDPNAAKDVRIGLEFSDLDTEDRALCVVTGMTIEDAITRHIEDIKNTSFNADFIQETMAETYTAYNRFTRAMKGLGRMSWAWFEDDSEHGPASPVLPYADLLSDSKEIDRRMVVVGLLKIFDQPNQYAGRDLNRVQQMPALQQARVDAESILTSVKTGKPYQPGYAMETIYK